MPENACPTCGTPMRERRSRLSARINGEDVAVAESPNLRCPKCGEVVLRYTDWRTLDERALEMYRKRYSLLSADEIRALRERLGLTQAGLARILRLGGNTISRWEAGRNAQTAAMDALLRLIRDVPGSLEYLRSHAEDAR